jgi:phosphoglycolate phosphatase
MSPYHTILFDLDGTLTDPKVGITKSVQYALARFGVEEKNLDLLEPFIGPPLADSFKAFYQLNDMQAQEAIAYYREYFQDQGLYENEVYPHIPDLLTGLIDAQKQLILSTSKPTVFARKILEHFGLNDFFMDIAGATLDQTRTTKPEIIQFIFSTHPELDRETTVMVGDRKHDIEGARHHNLDAIAVTYGYGSIQELQRARPTHRVDTVEELKTLLLT